MDPTHAFCKKIISRKTALTLLFASIIATQAVWGGPPNAYAVTVSPPQMIQAPNGERTKAVSINNHSLVVGTYGGPNGMTRSFTWTRRGGFQDIGEFTATGLNNCGDIVGAVNLYAPAVPADPNLPTRALLIRDGQTLDLGTLDPSTSSSWAYPTGINDLGHVSGMAGDFIENSLRPFLWTPETGMQALDEPQFHSGAAALNNHDQLVGTKQIEEFNGLQAGALWAPGQPVQILGSLGGRFGIAESINDNAEVIGNSATDLLLLPQRSGFYWSATTGVVPLQPYESQSTFDVANIAHDINAWGDIVGAIYAQRENFIEPRATLWTSYSDFFTFSDVSSEAMSINDRGQIVGILSPGEPTERAALWQIEPRLYLHGQDKRLCHRR
ncbi:MAG: hypothetical protein HY308_01015 [Gammaproteobacteria bacterium]|nr:hypothetical protein [Gammaproteobacteria bacterium]